MSVQLLRCESCGGSQPVSRAAQRDGWYRCAYCETPHATPVSPFEVYEGPDSAVVLLSSPGNHEFVLPAGSIMSTRVFGFGVFIVLGLGSMFAGGFQLNPPEHVLYRFGVPLVVVVGLICLALLLRARLSTQHVLVRTRIVEVFRDLGGNRWARKRFPSFGGKLSVEAIAVPDDTGPPRHKVELDCGDLGTVKLSCSGEREARWLAGMIAHGLSGPDAGRLSRCSGCGAPLDVGLREKGEGRLRCRYCDAGFVVDAKGVRWGPVRMPEPEDGLGLEPHRVRRTDGDGGLDYELLPGQAGARWFFGGGLAANTVFWGGFSWGMLGWLVPDALGDSNEVPHGLLSMLVVAGLMFAYLSGFTAIAAANILWGTERLHLSEGSLEHAWLLFGRRVPRWLQLGGWKIYRRLLTDNEERHRVNIFDGFTHPLHRSVALMRLSEVRFSKNEWGTVAELVSPARTLRLSWELGDHSDRWLRAQLVAEIADRLTRLGREVEYV